MKESSEKEEPRRGLRYRMERRRENANKKEEEKKGKK